jgi:FMN phosphatase YigB (HAD superfamily)
MALLVITAQDVCSYKSDLQNFEHMIRKVDEKLAITKGQILHTAQSQFYDHHPARKIGLRSSWIVRPGAIMGNRSDTLYDSKFDTLGDMADALRTELEASGV